MREPPGPDARRELDAAAPVFWAGRGAEHWTLASSAQRRKLVQQLQGLDLENYRRFMLAEIDWLRRSGRRDLERAAPGAAGQGLSRDAVLERVTFASLFESLGDTGREELLRGTPYFAPVGDFPEPLRAYLREYLRGGSSYLQNLPEGTLDRHWFGVLRARDPNDTKGVNLVFTAATPEGQACARTSGLMTIPHPLILPSVLPCFQLQPPDPKDTSRRVTLNLVPDSSRPGTVVRRNLDQILGVLASELKIDMVADGYVRPAVQFPANLQLKDYPLRQLLDDLSLVWGFDWLFLDKEEKTLLVRARNWWLEDAADVPQSQLERLKKSLGAGKTPTLEALLEFAELTEAQAHRLLDAGICPGASGVVRTAWYDETGVKPCLQFFARLSAPLRERALSPEGLPLREAPPGLVERWLRTTLTADCGAITPDQQRDLV